jgi:hypothetical protein
MSAKVGGHTRWIDRRMALAREWDELVEQVRLLDGFEDFLRPPPLELLIAAATKGPVVVVNVSRWRCDALIVTATGVEAVELPDLTAGELAERTATYLRVLRSSARVDKTLSFKEAMRRIADARKEREETLHSTMQWLWDAVADPVLRALGFTAPPGQDAPWPRVWWCPTGLLTLLPLHGAGYHASADDRSVLDRVVSSYTPTLRVLRESHASARQPSAEPERFLFVGVPDTPDQLRLEDEVAREVGILSELCREKLTVIDGAAATVDAVHDAMGQHSRVHFSCHGYQDLNNPSAAGLLLSDGTLTIPRISALRYAGEFAFLSACRTATGGLNLPDEVITLSAALNYSGYRHVVATLWSVHPKVAAEVTEVFYPQLTTAGGFDPERSALALHETVRALRRGGCALADWLPFTHNGP